MSNPIIATDNSLSSDSWGDFIELSKDFDLLISGTWSGTVTVQKSVMDPAVSSNWIDIQTFTANNSYPAYEPAKAWYQVGFASGGYTSGTARLELRQIAKNVVM